MHRSMYILYAPIQNPICFWNSGLSEQIFWVSHIKRSSRKAPGGWQTFQDAPRRCPRRLGRPPDALRTLPDASRTDLLQFLINFGSPARNPKSIKTNIKRDLILESFSDPSRKGLGLIFHEFWDPETKHFGNQKWIPV